MQEAIKKIREEMERNKGDLFTVETGKYVLTQIETNKEASKKISAGTKTIAGALAYLQGEAKKRAKSGDTCVMMTNSEGFEIMSKYFGFENIQDEMVVEEKIEPKVEAKEEVVEEDNVVEVDFSVNFDDLF